jgi:hypothetical protein
MATVLAENAAPGLIVRTLSARRDIGLGRRDIGCQAIAAGGAELGLPGRLKGETQLLAGYCAAAAGEAGRRPRRRSGTRGGHRGGAAAGGAGRLRRRHQAEARLAARVLLLDYRFLELLGPVNAAQIFDKAEPALLAVLAGDAKADPRCRSPPPRRRCGSTR